MRRVTPGLARSPLAPALLAALAWMIAGPAPAAAQDHGVQDQGPPRPCGPPPCRRLPPPPPPGYGPPPAIVSGYFPRPNALPMYNEPPARPPAY